GPPMQCFPPPAMAATAMAAPTALGHRRLSAQIYQRAERNGHRKYFDKFDCHRRTPLRQENLRQSVEFHKQTFRIALAMSALGQKRTHAVQNGMSALSLEAAICLHFCLRLGRTHRLLLARIYRVFLAPPTVLAVRSENF